MTATTQKGYRGFGMEGSIARWYDKNTRKDMDEFVALAARLRQAAPIGGEMLEVAPGPGFLSIEMAKGGRFNVTGLDISKTFVELARKNAADAGIKVDFREGNAAAIPFADNSFDLLVCRAAFKNFSEPVKALQEMNRVLRPGGTGLLIDLKRDTPMTAISDYAEGLDVGAINRWVIKQTFRFMLLKRAYTRQQFDAMVKQVPFGKVEMREAALGVEIWFSK